MKSKIFKAALYTLVMVLGLHSIALSQETPPPAKEKALEEKMVQMEQRLKEMQTRLDSMKTIAGDNFKIIGGGGIYIAKSPKALKASPKDAYMYVTPAPQLYKMPPTPPVAAIEGFGYIDDTVDKAFHGMAKSLNHTFAYEFSDKKLEEKIKSGEVKEKVKNYTKSFAVSAGDKLQIDNRYGKITVNTWNKNEFKVEVEIKSTANEDDDAQKLLDGTSIADSKDGSVISFTTKIASQNNSWGNWTNNGKSQVRKLEVNYVVYMPSKNSLVIKNRFGAVTLPDFDGKLLIDTQYGTFTAKELSNTENEITTRFTDVNIGSITGSVLNCQYGNGGNGLKIGDANNLKLDTRFIATDISRIKSSGNISVSYGGGLKINDLDKNLKTLNVNSSFAPVTVSSKSNNNFDFSVSVKFNTFKYDDDHVKITSKPAADDRHYSSTKTYVGYTGKGNSDTKVTINSSYQGVQFL